MDPIGKLVRHFVSTRYEDLSPKVIEAVKMTVLDTAGAALSGRIRLIPLQFADARVLGATLTTLFDQRYAAARTTDVQRNKPVILPDPRSNSLLITANQEDNRTIMRDVLSRARFAASVVQ